jgi:hypothetical protein
MRAALDAPRGRASRCADRLSWRAALAIVFGISLALWSLVLALVPIHG